MIVSIDKQKFRIEYEGLDQYDFEDFNLTKIEWFRYDRYIDLTDLIETMDVDLIELKVIEAIEISRTLPEP
jgi:hypothetical protein